jgi:hypothetical protein
MAQHPEIVYSCSKNNISGIIDANTGEYLLPDMVSPNIPKNINIELYHNSQYVTTTVTFSPYNLIPHPIESTEIVPTGTFVYDDIEYIYFVCRL